MWSRWPGVQQTAVKRRGREDGSGVEGQICLSQSAGPKKNRKEGEDEGESLNSCCSQNFIQQYQSTQPDSGRKRLPQGVTANTNTARRVRSAALIKLYLPTHTTKGTVAEPSGRQCFPLLLSSIFLLLFLLPNSRACAWMAPGDLSLPQSA